MGSRILKYHSKDLSLFLLRLKIMNLHPTFAILIFYEYSFICGIIEEKHGEGLFVQLCVAVHSVLHR